MPLTQRLKLLFIIGTKMQMRTHTKQNARQFFEKGRSIGGGLPYIYMCTYIYIYTYGICCQRQLYILLYMYTQQALSTRLYLLGYVYIYRCM